MKPRITFLFLIILMTTISCLKGQSKRSVRQYTIHADTIVVDTLSLVWGSVSVNGMDENDYLIDHINGRLIIQNPDVRGRTVTVFFRSYPYRLNREVKNKSLSIIEKRLYDPVNPFSVVEPISPIETLFSDANLNTYGSISRGISVGNAQSMVVNSNLNLQLSGKLDENIEISASITDQNIPIQPEGNTAQLKEFDKIYIMLKYKNMASVLAGDIETKATNTYFMRFTRQGQGLQGAVSFYNTDNKKDTTFYKIALSGSMAKGSFQRQTVTAIESVQGPYQLRGANGETYIMVLAGSERVYINSVLLKRGEDADYVINYNSGEITFTSRQMITKDKRILVEFEYSDRTYARSILHFNTEIYREKAALRFNFYNEQDMKNQPNQFDLTDEQKLFLATIGNNTSNAYIQNIDSVPWQNNEVLYKMTDTLVNGLHYDSVFVYSTSPDSACYRLGFSLVGYGNGDYILTQNVVNGRVYAWVAPLNGIPQGNYAPLLLLVAPKRTQMYSLALDYMPFKNTFFSVESALSNNDKNTFSPLDNQHNTGFALKIIAENTTPLHKQNPDPLWKMNIKGYYEVKNANFRHIEDYRDIDFARDYNLSDSLRYSTEHFAGISLLFTAKDKGKTGIVSDVYFIPLHHYQASNNHITADFYLKNYKIQFQTKLLNNKQSDYKTLFIQNNETFSKTFKYVEVGIANELELNLYHSLLKDTVMPQSFAFNEVSFFVKNGEALSASYLYGIRYANRLEAVTQNGILSANAMAHTLTANFDFVKYIDHQLRFNTSYRYFNVLDSLGENTLLSSLDYQGKFLKGAIQTGTYYEAGSGLEQKNEYSYLQVADGQGNYQWIDYNGNGVEELDEFEIDIYKDHANYIRIWLPSNQYVKTYNNQLIQSLMLRPMAVWRNERGFKKFIARFSNLTTYKTQLKNTAATLWGMINPFSLNNEDTLLIAASNNIRNVFSFNQTSAIWGVDIIYNNLHNKTLNINGFELTENYSWIFSGRYNIRKMFTLKSEYQNGWLTRSSEYLQNRNCQIYFNSIEGSFTCQYKTAVTLTAIYKYTQKVNKQGVEQSYNNNASLEFNYTIAQRGNLLLKASYYYILFHGEVSSSIAYEMLEALSPGNNGVFTFLYQTTLWQNLQLNLSYEGRIGETHKMKHLGNIELRAYF